MSGNDAEFLTDYVNIQLNPKLIDLKKIAKEFVASDKKEELLKKAESLVSSDLKGVQFAEWIVANMKKIVTKGNDFVTKEKTRLEGLINSKATVPEKKAEFRKRAAVLNDF